MELTREQVSAMVARIESELQKRNIAKTEFYKEYHEAVKRIGVRDLPPYSCRHTTGTEAAKQNLNAQAIQKIMRHGKITTSQRYIHLGAEEAHDGINKISITHT